MKSEEDIINKKIPIVKLHAAVSSKRIVLSGCDPILSHGTEATGRALILVMKILIQFICGIITES